MPTCLYGVLGHVHRPKSILHTQSLHSNPTPQIPPKWFWKLLTGFLVCSVNQPRPSPATQDKPFYPSPGPAVYGSNALSWARPKAGNLPLAPSKSIASTPGLPRHCRECQHLPTSPPASVPCQSLTFEQRATMPDVMSLIICAEFLVSLSEQKVLALSSVAVKFFGMNAADALHSQWSILVNILLVFHWFPLLWVFDTSPWDQPQEA